MDFSYRRAFMIRTPSAYETLLKEIMAYTRNNQTKASIMLGLNRGTLRKKLKQYDLIATKDQRNQPA